MILMSHRYLTAQNAQILNLKLLSFFFFFRTRENNKGIRLSGKNLAPVSRIGVAANFLSLVNLTRARTLVRVFL